MKLINIKNCCRLICAIIFSSCLFAEDLNSTDLISQQNRNNRKMSRSQSNMQRDPNTWKPYYIRTKDAEPLTSFYQQTVGVGFLYFSGVQGNLRVGPNGFNQTQPKSNSPLQGHMGYNRTPVVEFMVGTDIWYWLKIALSYTHQGGIIIQTQPQVFATTGINRTELTSSLQLDAALFRVFFMCPYTLVWKKLYYEPYVSAGVGPGWQTWADNKSYSAVPNTWRMKVSANCVFTADFGATIRRAMPTYMLAFNLGCKYTIWGQARSIGKIRDQYISSTVIGANNRQYLTNPLRIRTVYSFAPYIGMQLNF